MFHIVRKFELVNDEIKSTIQGYIPESKTELFYETFGTPFIDWVESNQETDKKIWFENNSHFYLIDTKEFIDIDIPLILDFEQLV